MKVIWGFLALALGFSLNVRADLPENNLYLQDGQFKSRDTMTESQFNEIADYVKSKMVGYVHMHYAWLSVEKRWDDPTVNAYASELGPYWKVVMFGGLARRPEITPDGFALVMCHELGHHLGGFPFHPSIFLGKWSANEGESDYFGTQVCAKEIWKDDVSGNALAAETVDGFAKAQCDNVYSKTEDKNLCYRTTMAGYSLANLLATIRNESIIEYTQRTGKVIPLESQPLFGVTDSSKVAKTYPGHPRAQCRLDTYIQGALCTAKFDLTKIPARTLWWGQNSAKAEQIAAQYSCTSRTHAIGIRPNCWFSNRF